MSSMFCNQCQEALNNYACEKSGVCGREPVLSNLMDILVSVCKGVSYLAQKVEKDRYEKKKADVFLLDSLFSTITNVNFDEDEIFKKIENGIILMEDLRKYLKVEWSSKLPPECLIEFHRDKSKMISEHNTLKSRIENEDIKSLKDIILYGLKGMAAYAYHSYILGKYDYELMGFMHSVMSSLLTENDLNNLLSLVMKTGEYGVRVMQMLDSANTERFGHPVPTDVYTGTKKGPAILVSGHDLLDLYELLRQTEGKGINVYTHGEMLPAHSYPELKKFSHLVGNFGTAWHNQRNEFKDFGGAILFTTNCLVKPDSIYKDNMFTTGTAGFPECVHIPDRKPGVEKDFSPLIEKALQLPGPGEKKGIYLKIGFGHNTILSVADKIVSAVKDGKIKKFVVMAGCDGRNKNREYYTEFAKNLPSDTVILTAGCAKYRYNMLALGDIEGIPRIVDAGQCNDSYTLAVTALRLKEMFGLDDINKLPIVYNIAWYEQKAVIVLLALLYLGVKNIRLGPTLPSFINKNVRNTLVERFGIKGIESVERDIKDMMA